MSRPYPDMASKIYLYYLRPSLEYACPVWHVRLTANQALSLERIKASVACSILGAEWHTLKDQLFQTLKWPYLRWRRTKLSVTLLHKLLYTSPAPIKSRLFLFSSRRSQRNLRKPQQLIIQHAGSTRRLKSFLPRYFSLEPHYRGRYRKWPVTVSLIQPWKSTGQCKSMIQKKTFHLNNLFRCSVILSCTSFFFPASTIDTPQSYTLSTHWKKYQRRSSRSWYVSVSVSVYYFKDSPTEI